MSREGEIAGELSKTIEFMVTVEWTVKDIFSYTKEDKKCDSPIFTLPDSQWFLRMYPNGESSDASGWISLYLCRSDDSATSKDVDFTFGVKKANGSNEVYTTSKTPFSFQLQSSSWGVATFVEQQILQQRKEELAPSGDFTITCTMKLKDTSESTSRFAKLSKNLEDLFISQKGCDATLNVQSKNFSVHRSILAARSPVLGTMFEVEMEEKKTGVVNIVDCHPGAFQDFLAYIYSGKFTISASNDVFQLYRIAHKYDVQDLMSDCVAYMIHNLSTDSLFDAAVIGQQFDENELQNTVQDFFNKEFKQIILTDKWDVFMNANPPLANKMLKNMVAK